MASHLTDDERSLFLAAQAGDVAARNELVLMHEPLVRKIVGDRFWGVQDRHDLYQEGVIGLIDAIADYDVDLGYRFSTYARWHIMNHVIDAAAQPRLVTIGKGVSRLVRSYRKSVRIWKRDNPGLEPDLFELARVEILRTSGRRRPDQSTVFALAAMYRQSCDTIMDDESNHPTVEPDPDVAMVRSEEIDRLVSSLDHLPDAELMLVVQAFGLLGSPPASVRAIARDAGIPYTTAHSRFCEILDRIRGELTIA